MSKREVLAYAPMLNPHTVAVALRSLYAKGYLEVAEIKSTGTALARVYRPSMPISTFLRREYGEMIVMNVIKKVLTSLEDDQQLTIFLEKIAETKEQMRG